MPRFRFGRRPSSAREPVGGGSSSHPSSQPDLPSRPNATPQSSQVPPTQAPPRQPPRPSPPPYVDPKMSYLADELKGQGNTAFRAGDYALAENYYTQAIQKHSRNPLIFTNRANTRLKLQDWDGAVNDSLKSIEITGADAHNHKAYHFLAQAQLALNHPHEALTSALTAYEQVLHPSPTAKTSPRDLQTLSAFVLKCKKARFSALDRDRLRRDGDLRAELEDLLARELATELSAIQTELGGGSTVAARERDEEARAAHAAKVGQLRSVFAVADPALHAAREVPDHLVDMITFEPMHDPVITKNGHSYERATIYEHLKHSATDPLTREPLAVEELRSNFGLKAACDAFWESGASQWIGDW